MNRTNRKFHFMSVGLIFFLLVATFRIASGAEGKEIQTDTKLKIFGWSSDEKYWAFGESGDYSGGALAGATVRYYVIDSVKNAFFKKFESRITEQEGYDDDAKIAQAVLKFEKETEERIRGLGLNGAMGEEVYKKPVAVWVDYDSVIKQFGEKNPSFDVDKNRYDLKLEDKIVEGKDPCVL